MSDSLRPLREAAAFQAAMTAPLAVVYKHSTRCGLSSGSLAQMRQFADRHPDIPVYLVDVIADRDLARQVADGTGVRHESPQVILLHAGLAVWDASHFAVSCQRLERALADRQALSVDGSEAGGSHGLE